MFVRRLLEEKLLRLAKDFKAVLIVGARQVGKSTLLAHCFPNIKHITFDALTDNLGVKADPLRFLNNFKAPIILDEIQYCPELLAPLKRYIDQSEQKGQYFLTSSQNLSVLKGAAESMAGRIAIMQLDALTIEELAGVPQNFLSHYLNNPFDLVKNFSGHLPLTRTLYEMIWRGGMPGILNLDNHSVSDYFFSYVKTYIERDVRLLENIKNLSDFERFVRLTAALTAQEVNYSHLGRELGIARNTATHWLDTLKHTYQWYEIMPYHGNALKRLSKKPKGYFHDTGIVCYLQRISSPEALAAHPLLGALFENFVMMNLLKLSSAIQTPPYAYHWRTDGGAEVDLIFERDGKLFPIEIKCKAELNKHDIRGLKTFYDTYPKEHLMPGLIIYAGNECYLVDDNIIAMPWNAVFS